MGKYYQTGVLFDVTIWFIGDYTKHTFVQKNFRKTNALNVGFKWKDRIRSNKSKRNMSNIYKHMYKYIYIVFLFIT